MPEKTGAMQAEVNIGLIGHVDHGKTSLTKALTGKWTDTHSEELKKGISIRLGYADAVFRKCPKCQGAEAFTAKEKCGGCGTATKVLRKVSFVDAPGHETLMTTMLSGAALMNGAILVIAANEKCPQPRTIEHLMALNISGTKKIVVAQNKVDLVAKEKALENMREIKKFLEAHGYKGVPIIPTTANHGVNIDLLIEAIEENIPTPEHDPKKPLKMFVARSFDINKPGTKIDDLAGGVLGGSISEGQLKPGDAIEITPGIDGKPINTKAVELSVEEGKINEARPGGLISIRTNLDPSISRNDMFRGQMVAKPGSLPAPVKGIKMEVKQFERVADEKPMNIAKGEKVVVTTGTATIVGQVASYSKGLAEIALNSPAVVVPGQNIALSKLENSRWRLVAYGGAK